MPDLDEADFFSEKPVDSARRIITENAPFAASSIAKMAMDSTISPSVRLRAAQYIVDRNLGPISAGDSEANRLEAFLEELQSEANKGV